LPYFALRCAVRLPEMLPYFALRCA
jgi:hypothetical protein